MQPPAIMQTACSSFALNAPGHSHLQLTKRRHQSQTLRGGQIGNSSRLPDQREKHEAFFEERNYSAPGVSRRAGMPIPGDISVERLGSGSLLTDVSLPKEEAKMLRADYLSANRHSCKLQRYVISL